MISIENLYKSFNGNEVIRGVSLNIERGEIMALIGKSGIGKSVILKHIAGLLRPDRGRISVMGKDVSSLGTRDLMQLRRHLGLLFQGGALFDSMTVYDNVAFPLREKTRMKEEEITRRVMNELGQVGLSEARDKYPSQLSGGMTKRAALARELIWRPEIMLFDEPTTGLDPIISNAILKLIKSVHERLNFTGVIVTHEINQVFGIIDRAAMLHDGIIIALGKPEEILSSQDPVVKQFIRGETEGPISFY